MENRIGSILRQARRRRGLSQAEVAEALGVAQQQVSSVERGHGGIEQVAKVCRALGLHLALEIDGRRVTIVHPIDPAERAAIEANIDWFSRLSPARRLRAIAGHVEASRRLREHAVRGA